jgi:septum formation protein
MKIILASQSPRRKELLEKIDRVFTVEPSHYDEQLDVTRPTEEVARELALGKARDVARRFPEAIVIGADTIVEIDGEQLGKPHDEEEAVAMLRRLRGRSHHVVTGVAVVAHGQRSMWQLIRQQSCWRHTPKRTLHHMCVVVSQWTRLALTAYSHYLRI